MLKNINFTEEQIKRMKILKTQYSNESTIYPFLQNNQMMLLKLFNEDTNIENKTQKIILLKDRLKNIKNVVTADKLAYCNGSIKGYTMNYIKGNLFIPNSKYSLEEIIIILKQISKSLKTIHEQNIVCADFQRNILINNCGDITFIDHDNFAIDSFEVDLKNIYLQKYEEQGNCFNKYFDYYLLNLLTLSSINFIETRYIYDKFITNPELFYFVDDEITNIMLKTLYLDNMYNQELIIDKIKNENDLKKIKHKFI